MAKGPIYGEFDFSKGSGFGSSADGYARGGKVKPFWDKPAPEGKPSHLSKKQKAGFSGLERSMVKFHNKIALPFASLIIILIGVPLSAKKKRGGLASEISVTLFVGFLFLGVQKTSAIAGDQGMINPMLAAWIPNILFLGIGYAIYKTAID